MLAKEAQLKARLHARIGESQSRYGGKVGGAQAGPSGAVFTATSLEDEMEEDDEEEEEEDEDDEDMEEDEEEGEEEDEDDDEDDISSDESMDWEDYDSLEQAQDSDESDHDLDYRADLSGLAKQGHAGIYEAVLTKSKQLTDDAFMRQIGWQTRIVRFKFSFKLTEYVICSPRASAVPLRCYITLCTFSEHIDKIVASPAICANLRASSSSDTETSATTRTMTPWASYPPALRVSPLPVPSSARCNSRRLKA